MEGGGRVRVYSRSDDDPEPALTHLHPFILHPHIYRVISGVPPCHGTAKAFSPHLLPSILSTPHTYRVMDQIRRAAVSWDSRSPDRARSRKRRWVSTT